MAVLKKLGWDTDLTAEERAAVEKVAGATPVMTAPGATPDAVAQADYDKKIGGINWKVDLSGGIQRVAIKHGCAPYGNGKARAIVWESARIRCRCIASRCTRRGAIWWRNIRPTRPQGLRLPTLYASIQKVVQGIPRTSRIILTSGRLVEYEGGGDETRSNKWLAELQQDMFSRSTPPMPARCGIKDGGWVWVHWRRKAARSW